MAKKTYPILEQKPRILSLEEDYLRIFGLLSFLSISFGIILGSLLDILYGMLGAIVLEIVFLLLVKSLQRKMSFKDLLKFLHGKKSRRVIRTEGFLLRDLSLKGKWFTLKNHQSTTINKDNK